MIDDLSVRAAGKALLLPPGVFVWLILLSVLAWRHWLGRVLAVSTAAGLYLLSTPFVAAWLAAGLEIHAPLNPDTLQERKVEALVVLMAGRHTGAQEFQQTDSVSRYSRDRLSYAAYLHHETGLPIILSGGLAKGEHPALAILGAAALRGCGIQVAALETQSRNTWENAANLLPMLAEQDIDKIALITHAWHMRRALASFHDSGLDILPAPTYFVHEIQDDGIISASDWLPHVNSLHDSTNLLHEYLGLLWYQHFQASST